MSNNMKAMDGNEATAHVAYRVSDISAIYPITPSSPMGEEADLWASQGIKNIWGVVPQVVELQSEGGASGALHGAAQAGALATTYTASQGLLLMIPNMYKIAGELTPCVIHASARSLAVQALSIFGDHSDVMAVRDTGFAMLCSGSVQEAHDMAMVAHAATLESRIPFLHFFEGFRTSHEVNKISVLTDAEIRDMIDEELVVAHHNRALTSDAPVVRGTSQNPDVYFQGRETVNGFYDATPAIVEKAMEKLAKLTGRHYDLVEYYGDAHADRVIVILGSGAETVRETIDVLREKGEKIGMLQVRLFRPFPIEHFLKVLPATVKTIGVLDRTKESGATGEPLYQDVLTLLGEAFANGSLKTDGFPKVVGGRYGLSSKEFTPAMVKGVFDELAQANPKNHFTIGIEDDVTFTSLTYDPAFITESSNVIRAIFYGLGSDGTVGANKNSIKIIADNTDNYAQGYFVYDSKKAGTRTMSHLRFGSHPIRSPYLVQSANFIGVHQFNFVDKTDVLGRADEGATFLLNSTYGPEEVWDHLPCEVQQIIIDRKLSFYVVDAYKVAQETGMGDRINTIMQTCFFELAKVLPSKKAIEQIKQAIRKTYMRKGEDVVQKNYAAVDSALAHLYKVKVPGTITGHKRPPVVSEKAPEFVRKVLAPIMADRGDELPVSAMPCDGTFPMGTTCWEKRNVSMDIAYWHEDKCIQCGKCSVVCPHAIIRAKRYDKSVLEKAPDGFRFAEVKGKGNEDRRFTMQLYLEDCTGCGLCVEACPVKGKAITLEAKAPILEQEQKNIEFFETIPFEERATLKMNTVLGIQFAEPQFEFSGSCAGCGETPYVKLLTQLFGDRMIIANATGCSSIYGGNLPTAPWTVDKNGRGPAWSNSLFEDNAEFGFGFRLAEDRLMDQAAHLLQKLAQEVGTELTHALLDNLKAADDVSIGEQRERVAQLKKKLKTSKKQDAQKLLELADHLVHHCVWALGGDGWAYDIGFGGLDHVLASGRNINLFVMDTEVYSNTGGQASKATPRGAIAKFAAGGKPTAKKDLGLMMMTYGYIYVAQIALGADAAHAIKSIHEAEAYDGPSLIIAYSHCIAHGINMRYGMNQQKLAVECGYWPLYRYNPNLAKEGKNPFTLDSKPPSIPLKDYIQNETRFKALEKIHPEAAEALFKQAQEDVDRRWLLYKLAART